MNKPHLIIVTGKPGSGKTTFAGKLGDEINMLVISRDKIKEGYIHTVGRKHKPEDNKTVTDIFFDTLADLVERGVSIIAEAAFQHNIWEERLKRFKEKAQLSMIICKADDEIIRERLQKRDKQFMEHFHGDIGLMAGSYDEPRLNDVNAIYINTEGEYNSAMKELIEMILNKKERK